ncbi:hypothetical protein ZTR_01034 [Talaromyces verruculosus]|nr:hypothetical protein ZTR_01034 [Talaromyces verruculosus]
MARTRGRNLSVPLAQIKPFRRHVGQTPARLSSTPPNSANPSQRSVQLFFSLPHFVVTEIFALALADDLFSQANKTPFFCYVSLRLLVIKSKTLRSICRSWTRHLRSYLFAGLGARCGLFALVYLTELSQIQDTFPMLNHCVLDPGDMMDVAKLEECLSDLQYHSSELSIVKAVTWSDASFQHMNPISYGSMRTSRSRTRILQEYLEYQPLAEFLESLTKRVIGFERLSPIEIRDTLFSELMALHYYHAHLLRNILSCVVPIPHLTIPTFIMPLLLGDWTYDRAENSRIEEKLDSIKNKGKPIRAILRGSQQVQFVGLPTPFVLPWGENTGVEQLETQRKMLIRAYHKIAESTNFPTEFPWPSRRIGFHGALELIDPDSSAEWWLRFLESAMSSGKPPSVCITVGSTKTSLPIGPPNLSLRPTREYFTQRAHLHLCEEIPKLSLGGITRLDLNLLTICPLFFTNAKKYLPSIAGVWRITSAPQLCSHWVETHPTPLGDQIAEDLAVIEQIMHQARGLGNNLDLRISFSYHTAHLPRSLLCPIGFYG